MLKPKETLAEHIFIDLADEGLLVAPGSMFIADESALSNEEATLRIAFSNGTVCIIFFLPACTSETVFSKRICWKASRFWRNS